MEPWSEAERQRFHEENLRILREFRPIDDTFMRCLFRDDLELAEFVLRIILDKPDLKLVSMETQKDLKRLLGARSLCLDVHGIDSENRQYDIEIQRADLGASPKRARYHAAAMDIEALDAGQDFDALPECYTIFITESDLFGRGAGVYPVERVNLVTGEMFGDWEHILFVNGQYRGEDALGHLMHDFLCNNPNEMHFPIMSDRARSCKENSEEVVGMCKAMDDMRREMMEMGEAKGEAKGKAEGRQEELLKNVRSLKAKLGLSNQQVKEALEISLEDWAQIAAMV